MPADTIHALTDRYLDDRRSDLTDALSLCESPLEQLFLVALLCQGDRSSHFLLTRAPRRGYPPIALGCSGCVYVQHEIAGYYVDFAYVGDREQRLAVEIDGHEYHSTREQKANDAARDRAIVAAGWTVVRFPGSDVHADPDRCAREFCALVGLRTGTPTPEPMVRPRKRLDPALELAATRRNPFAQALGRCRSVADEEAVMRDAQNAARRKLGGDL